MQQIISDFMNNDHAHIDQLWADFLAQKNNAAEAKKSFQKYYNYLTKHIDLENNELYPRFDRFIGFEPGNGPTTILKHDHSVIGKLLNEIRLACETNDSHHIDYLCEHFQKAMASHRERENQLEYPLLDRIISQEEWQKIMQRIYQLQF